MSKRVSALNSPHQAYINSEHRARKLLVPERDYLARGANPVLRSGLYVMRTFTPTIEEQVYVLYWPGDTTWNDDAVSTVEHTRVTFMRYRSASHHLFSQMNVSCVDTLPNYVINSFAYFQPSTHARLYYGEKPRLTAQMTYHSTQSVMTRTDFSTSRLQKGTKTMRISLRAKDLRYSIYISHLSLSNHPITIRWKIKSSLLSTQPSPTLTNTFLSTLTPRLLYGETTQGFMTTHCWPARATIEPFSYDNKSARQIRRLL